MGVFRRAAVRTFLLALAAAPTLAQAGGYTITGPPASPGREPRQRDAGPVAQQCAVTGHNLAARGGGRLVVTIATRSGRWGEVWRADALRRTPAARGERRARMTRFVCWRDRRSGRYVFMSQPLRMIDGSEDLPPLPRQ